MILKKYDTSSLHSSAHPVEISVIVCHHKGDFIYSFVESVKKSVGVSYEIIVITSDDHLAVTGIEGCRVFNGDQYPASKRNAGARVSNGKYLAFFDDDVTIEPNCLLEFYKLMENTPSCGMAYGKLYKMGEGSHLDEAGGYLTRTGFIWSRAEQNIEDDGQFEQVEAILAGKSASCIIREEVFFKVGGFDEDFGILGEETDLSWRVWLRDQRVLFCPTTIGYHAFNTKMKPAKDYYTSKRVQYNGCRNYITMLLKNLETWNLCRILPLHIFLWFSAGLAMILTLRFKQGWNIWSGIGYVLKNWGKIMEKRRRVQKTRAQSDKDLFTYIYRNPRGTYYLQRFARYLTIGLHG